MEWSYAVCSHVTFLPYRQGGDEVNWNLKGFENSVLFDWTTWQYPAAAEPECYVHRSHFVREQLQRFAASRTPVVQNSLHFDPIYHR